MTSKKSASEFQRIVFIVNPQACKGQGRALFDSHLPQIRAKLHPDRIAAILYTEAPRDATRLVHRAVEQFGADLVVACGGDGTNHEVLNGLMELELELAQTKPPRDLNSPNTLPHCTVAMALFPLGTGNDFAKSAHYTRVAQNKYENDYVRIVDTLANGTVLHIDVGQVESCSTNSGEKSATTRRYFLNEASFGVSAAVMDRVNSATSHPFGQNATFQFQTLWQQLVYRNKQVELTLRNSDHSDDSDDSSTVKTIKSVQQLTAVSNGKYFGSGMLVAPSASICDGQFNLTTLGDVSLWNMLWILPRIYDGTHLEHPKVSTVQASVVEARATSSEGEDIYVEADGELCGTLPAKFTCLHAALPFVVPRSFCDAEQQL